MRRTNCPLTLKIHWANMRRSHIIASRKFLIDRDLKTHSLLMPTFLEGAYLFPACCVLRVTHCLECLLGGYFFSSNFPHDLTVGKASHSEGRQTNMQTFILSSFLYRRDLVCLSIFANYRIMWEHLECEVGYLTLVKLCSFVLGLPKWYGLSTAWKSIQ